LPGWIWDKPVYVDFNGGCCTSKRRIDLRILVEHQIKGLFWLCIGIKIDENQHKSYAANYEEERYNNLFVDFSGRYVFLRLNPDPYRVQYYKVDQLFEETFTTVGSVSKRVLESGPVEGNLVEVHHYFYDE